MVATFANVFSRPLLQFLEALLLGNAAQTPCLLETSLNPFPREKGGTPVWISLLYVLL